GRGALAGASRELDALRGSRPAQPPRFPHPQRRAQTRAQTPALSRERTLAVGFPLTKVRDVRGQPLPWSGRRRSPAGLRSPKAGLSCVRMTAPPLAFDPTWVTPTEEHRLLRETVRAFTREVIEPQADEHDRTGTFNRLLLEECGKLGLLGITIPVEDGGAGMDSTAAVIAHHEMSQSDVGFTLAYLAHAVLFVNNFYYNAGPDLRRRYLSKVLSGAWLGAMGMTEPNAGTDVLGMRTTARRDGDRYIISGRKALITNAPEADIFLLYAKLDGRITAFILER